MLLLNSPHNPTGKVFSPDELGQVAALCRAHDLLAVTDEVYEHLVFDGSHIPLATLPGMGERTLTISSGGKTFSFTGWKVGWVSGPAPLVAAVRAAKQFLTYTSPAPLQLAIARGLGFPPTVMGRLAAELEARRDQLCDGLVGARATTSSGPPPPTSPRPTSPPVAPGLSAEEFCLALPERCGVVAIPSSVFYDPADPDAGRTLVRWAFCKRADVLDDALARLASWAHDIPITWVDAFSDVAFGGNPAAVCLLRRAARRRPHAVHRLRARHRRDGLPHPDRRPDRRSACAGSRRRSRSTCAATPPWPPRTRCVRAASSTGRRR